MEWVEDGVRFCRRFPEHPLPGIAHNTMWALAPITIPC